MCSFYPGLSRDLVIAGIFLHDIAKTWELNYDCAFSYSDGGQLVGHIVKSAMWVEHKARAAEATLGEKIPQPLIDVLQHIILSHHGTPEFGAAKTPATPEAIAVHFIENMDAKLMMSLSATRGEGATGSGNWTEYMKAFGVRLYRPDQCLEPEEPEPPSPSRAAGNGASHAPAAPSSVASIHRVNGESHLPAGNEPPVPGARLAINNPLFEPVPPRKK